MDDATNREKRDIDFMKSPLKEKYDAARERERLIREDMRQLAASEARVAVLQQQLQGQAFQPPNSRSEMFGPSGRSYFAD